MIREAAHDDIPALVEMGRAFHGMSPHNPLGEYNGGAIASVLAFMIDSPQAVVLTNGTGVIGGVYAPVFFNPAKWMLEESFWWAQKDGMALLDAMTDHARGWGASSLLMSTLENDKSMVIDRVMTRKGFTMLERRYVKELN